MSIIGTGYCPISNSSERVNEAVKKTSGSSPEPGYFQDQNPENTKNNDFSRALRGAQQELADRDRRIRKLHQSEDLKALQSEQTELPDWVETALRVSEWNTHNAQIPQDILRKKGW